MLLKSQRISSLMAPTPKKTGEKPLAAVLEKKRGILSMRVSRMS